MRAQTLSIMLPGLVAAWAAPSSSQPVAVVSNGSLSGFHDTIWHQDYFLGIPYAQPPVGNLRFAVPQPLNQSWTAARSVEEYGPACVSYGVCSSSLTPIWCITDHGPFRLTTCTFPWTRTV